jgi:hypothetical protein
MNETHHLHGTYAALRHVRFLGPLLASFLRCAPLVALTTAIIACSSDNHGRPSGNTATEGPHCTASGGGCACHFSDTPSSLECSTSAYPDTFCCASSGWPNGSSTCECKKGETWKCAVSKSTGSCRCSPTVVVSAGEIATRSCSVGGETVCCKTSNTCNCKKAASCASGETSVETCGGTMEDCGADTKTASCSSEKDPSSNGSPTCKDKGYCGPTSDRCDCGLSCLHLAAGSYTCGDSCSRDSDCTSRKDPQSGKPYSRCAMATLTGFCS